MATDPGAARSHGALSVANSLLRRIERAKELLRATDMPVAEIAFAVGFSSQSHVSNWFQRMIGISPAAYRKSC